ncbi:hypothetical protein ACS3SW_20805 [Roseobacteraceae bacterium S113]
MGLITNPTVNSAQTAQGAPAPFAKRYIYHAGSDTLSRLFRDPHLTEPRSNPMHADENGVFELCYLVNGSYRVMIEDRRGNELMNEDNIVVDGDLLEGQLRVFGTGQEILNDTLLSYAEGGSTIVARPGQTLLAADSGCGYRVAPADVTDFHLQTAGGVKLYVQSGSSGANLRSYLPALDGVTDDTAALQQALDTADRIDTSEDRTAIITQTLHADNAPRAADLYSVRIRQGDGANLSEMITHSGFGNDSGLFRARLDGNRDANTTPVTGFCVNGTMAGTLIELDIAGQNCDTLVHVPLETEHCEIRAAGRSCGTVLEINTETNTCDENNITIYGYQSDTLFKTTGAQKSSGQVDVFGEVISDWALNLENGWYSLGGIVRSCGVTSGGGVRIANSQGGRFHFRGLQLYGQTPAPNNGTVGLLCESSEAFLEGQIILGQFDQGAWIKSCKLGSSLRLNVTSTSANGDALRFGDAAGGSYVDGAFFDVETNGAPAAHYGIHLDNVRNSVVRILGNSNGGDSDVHIGATSFDNTIEIGRRIANSRVITSDRTQNDNVVMFMGSYTDSDLGSLNGGNYFPGMWVQEYRLGGQTRSAAYWDGDVNAWVATSNMMDEKGVSQLGDAGNSINTLGKYRGKQVWDANNHRALRANGPNPTDRWDALDGSAAIVPA